MVYLFILFFIFYFFSSLRINMDAHMNANHMVLMIILQGNEMYAIYSQTGIFRIFYTFTRLG